MYSLSISLSILRFKAYTETEMEKEKEKKKKTVNEKGNEQHRKDTNDYIPAYLGRIYWITVE